MCAICFLTGPRFAAASARVVIDLGFLPAVLRCDSLVWGDGMQNWEGEASSQRNLPPPWLWVNLSCPLVPPDELYSNVKQVTRAPGVSAVVAVRWPLV